MCTLKTNDFSGNEVYVLTRVVYLVRHTFPETYNIRKSEENLRCMSEPEFPVVILFSNLNEMFLGCCDPVNIVLRNRNKQY